MFCKVYIGTSIDGYIAGPNNELEWLDELPNPDENDFGYFAHMESIDALVMGSGTFGVIQDFRPWPYDKPVIVASSSMTAVPADLEGKVEIVAGDPTAIVAHCEGLSLNRLYVDGGKLVTSFLAEGLIDEMTISTLPVLLGAGIKLFGQVDTIWWDHVNTESFNGGMVQSTYARKNTAAS